VGGSGLSLTPRHKLGICLWGKVDCPLPPDINLESVCGGKWIVPYPRQKLGICLWGEVDCPLPPDRNFESVRGGKWIVPYPQTETWNLSVGGSGLSLTPRQKLGICLWGEVDCPLPPNRNLESVCGGKLIVPYPHTET
jgi:hypothetical protein